MSWEKKLFESIEPLEGNIKDKIVSKLSMFGK